MRFPKRRLFKLNQWDNSVTSLRGNTWAFEIWALVLSISALSALIALLVHVNDTPLSQWTFFISINGLISTLAAVSRASLGFAISSCLSQAKWNWFRRREDSLAGFARFDDASRGPWGSVWLIIWLRARHWVVLGAVVTILLLAFEPLFQSVIKFPGRRDETNRAGRAFLGRREFVTSDRCQLAPYFEGLSQIVSFRCNTDMRSVSAFYNGYSKNSQPSIPISPSFLCPTGNCTWTPFLSLGLCSSCNDMTNMLKRQVFNTTSEYLQLPPEEDEPQRIHIGYKLGSIDLTNTIDSIGGEPSSGCMIGTEHAYPEATLSYKGLGTMLYSVQIIRSDKTFEEGATTWPQTKVTATECALQFCVNAYNTVVDNGRLSESVTASWSTLDPASYQPYGISEDEIVYWNNQGRDTFIYAPDYLRTDLEIFIPEDDRANYNISGDRRFGLTQNAIQELGQAFHDHAEWQNHFEYPQTVGTKANREEILYRSENLTATFQSVAESITSFLRDNSNLTQDGLAQEWSIYAQVNWPLLMAPLLTNLLGLLFCALCMLQTRNLKLDPWKTDMIATLAHSLDMKTRDQLRDASLRGSLSKMAGDVNVRFVDGVDGLEMRKAD